MVTRIEIDRLGERELVSCAETVRVFARVSPQHKYRIVRALKKAGHVVAMTGDGVNDAPAIKEADIGVSMGLMGTEVTKEASSMILADDDFSTIEAAIYEGRAIYDNIRKFIKYLLGCNAGEVLTMFMAALLGMPLPLVPIQILWVNLITDGLPAMALGLEPPEPGVMDRKPRSKDEGVFSRGLGWQICGMGLFVGITTLAMFTVGLVYAGVHGRMAWLCRVWLYHAGSSSNVLCFSVVRKPILRLNWVFLEPLPDCTVVVLLQYSSWPSSPGCSGVARYLEVGGGL